MAHRLLICGAGRIGAGFNWNDDGYTHAGAARALSDRIELVGFVETDKTRAKAAEDKWNVKVYTSMNEAIQRHEPDVVSVCTPPVNHSIAVDWLTDQTEVQGIWVEKPYSPEQLRMVPPWVQVNYLRRADPRHQAMAAQKFAGILTVTAKDDIHTRCHFEDLAKWWRAELVYQPIKEGPCSYVYRVDDFPYEFKNGGVDPAACMKGMLGNLMDTMEGKTILWSPPA